MLLILLFRYFCMYHAKHPEAIRRPGYYTASGAFMGFDSEESDEGEMDVEAAATKPAPVLDSPDHLPIFEVGRDLEIHSTALLICTGSTS